MSDDHFLARAYAAFADDQGRAAEFLRWLAGEHGLPPKPRLLDIGTGPGLLLKHLDAAGWRAEGLEPELAFVRYARAEGLAVQCGGFAELEAEAQYDMITGLGSPLAYLPDFRARRAALKRVRRALLVGGLAVMEVWNMPRVLRYYAEPQPITARVDGHTLTLTRRHTFDDHRGAMTQHEVYRLDDGQHGEMTHTLYMVTIAEIVALYEELGFTGITTYNGYDARQAGRVTGSRGLVVGVRL